MQYFRKRERERERWYSKENFETNLKKIISQIEDNTQRRFSLAEKNEILACYLKGDTKNEHVK